MIINLNQKSVDNMTVEEFRSFEMMRALAGVVFEDRQIHILEKIIQDIDYQELHKLGFELSLSDVWQNMKIGHLKNLIEAWAREYIYVTNNPVRSRGVFEAEIRQLPKSIRPDRQKCDPNHGGQDWDLYDHTP